MRYTTKGTCSRFIDFDVEDNKVTNVRFTMGCNGNTQGVAAVSYTHLDVYKRQHYLYQHSGNLYNEEENFGNIRA